ncbi:hypothetical protein WMY93_012845 [Mugilogobius chulae]|uniref:Gypsy retrotransposon integrase-like protein 1 n=1 Tax=Mugilogobius chulae TaxID=88201 RepID=A0AAW0P1V0_9GOBI
MPRPTDVKAVQRLLGMANYLAKFCPHLSDQCEVLRQLTHKDTEWEWTEQHENAFVKLKETIADAPVLKYYSPEDDLVVQCDASDTGLGAALMQTGKPIAFASRALTQTERGYAQIEKEFLAMVFSVEKFHQYTYGRKVTVQSDHKPLETIVRKPLLSAPKRLQRMMLRIQKYDLNVVYVPGKDMLLADTLSRAYLPECSHKDSVEAEVETVNMVQHLPISSDSLSQIRTATKDDKTLQTVIKMMQQGWPSDKRAIPPEIRPYFSFQDELSHQDGIVFKGERAVIPFSLQKDITSRLHSSHLGAEGCLRRARECVFWIGMNDHIKTHIARCSICRHRNTPSQGLDTSPAQRLLSRRTRALLPSKLASQPKVIRPRQALHNNQRRQCAYYNRSARDLIPLKLVILSYEVEMESGAVLRRNRRHLRRAHEAPQTVPTDIETVNPEVDQTTQYKPDKPFKPPLQTVTSLASEKELLQRLQLDTERNCSRSKQTHCLSV